MRFLHSKASFWILYHKALNNSRSISKKSEKERAARPGERRRDMERKERVCARYAIIQEEDGRRYRFFCEASGAAIYTSRSIRADTPDREPELAWEEGRQYFNRCQKCGKWVCNIMTNADTLSCVDCSPWENPPRYCPECGIKLEGIDPYCRGCGARLMYGGDGNAEAV